MPQNTGKYVTESCKFQNFPGEHALNPPRGVSATCHACQATTIHFSCLLSSDQTPITFSNDNPEPWTKPVQTRSLQKINVDFLHSP